MEGHHNNKTENISFNSYSKFVEQLTSSESNHFNSMIDRLNRLKEDNSRINISLLLTSALGLSSESGEYTEIVKKIIFQKKSLTNDNIFHAKRELGDIIFYWINACRSLNLDPNDVIKENVSKLKSRYPNGSFEEFFSENRKPNDL